MNILRERIERGEQLCGTIVSLTDPCLCEVFGRIGYDYIWIDMEHTYASYKEILCHLNAARSVGTPAIVRVPQADLTVTKKILEMGPEGIIFPMIRTADEAKAVVDMTLYPPRGTRGFGPMRAIGYGAVDAKTYTEKGSLELCRFIQIEHVDCIRNLDKIVEIPYIDGFIFGPNDLSGSIGELGHPFGDNTGSLMREAISFLRQHHKYIGIAGGNSQEALQYWSSFEIDMLTAGADWNFVFDQGRQTLKEMQRIFLHGKCVLP